MDKQTLNIFNAAIVIVVFAVAFFAWFYMRDQFMWGMLLITLVLLFAGLVNITRKMPWQEMSFLDAAVAVAALAILGFAWFYMRDQFCWAGNLVVLLLAIAAGVKVAKWFRDVVSVQVVVHKKETDEGGNKK